MNGLERHQSKSWGKVYDGNSAGKRWKTLEVEEEGRSLENGAKCIHIVEQAECIRRGVWDEAEGSRLDGEANCIHIEYEAENIQREVEGEAEDNVLNDNV